MKDSLKIKHLNKQKNELKSISENKGLSFNKSAFPLQKYIFSQKIIISFSNNQVKRQFWNLNKYL